MAGNISERRAWLALVAVLLVGLGVRIGWGLCQSSDAATIDQLPDQREYLDLARNLHNHGQLWFADARFDQPVYAYRTPGYPIFVSWCGVNPAVVRVVQAILDASDILAIYLLARRWLSSGRSLLAAALVAVNPYLIFFTGMILTETLFTTMLVWGTAMLVLSGGPWPASAWRRRLWLAGAAVLALSILVRPGALGIVVLMGCAAAWINAADPTPRLKRWPIPVAATMLLITVLVLLPWALRNRWVLKSWVWTSTNSGITLYDGFNPDATGAGDQLFVQRMPWTREMTELGRCNYFASLADDWIANHPRQALDLAAVKIARTWSPVALGSSYASRTKYFIVGLTYGLALDVMVVLGLWRGLLPRSVKLTLLGPAAYLTIAAALSVGSLRYRVPAEAPMAIVAAAAGAGFRRPRSDAQLVSSQAVAGG